MNRLVHGVGVNDAGYSVAPTIHGVQVIQKKYLTWRSMLERCYGKSSSSRMPTYSECSVAPEWHVFSVFSEWMERQDWKGKHLDKDLLFVGNKIYSPDTCVFIEQSLNKFLHNREISRPNFLLGASFDKKRNAFNSKCSNPFTGKQEWLGYFKTAEEAHEAWRKRKHEFACIYADQQSDQRIAKALRERFAQ